MIEIETRRFLCSCTGCSLTLEGSNKFRALSPKTEFLSDFHLSDPEWESLQFPIDIVFFFRSGSDNRPIAIYPSPAGGVESALSAEAWAQLVESNPMLDDMLPDVEALLINRTKGARDYYLVSIDRCYALVGLIRTRWRGLSGGADVWDGVSDFFSSLKGHADEPGKMFLHG